MDPLSVLRDYTIRNDIDKILRIKDEFHFSLSDTTFPCSIQTTFRSKQGFFYTLETLVFFIQNQHIKHTEYFQNSKRHKIPSVTLPDRKPLLDFLTGKVSTSDQIEESTQLPILNPTHFLNSPKEQNPERLFGFESVLRDREGFMDCKNRDFYGVLTASLKREEEHKRVESQQRKDGLVAKSKLMGPDEEDNNVSKAMLKGPKVGEGVPIILVPSAFQTLITIYNVKEFLEDGVFITSDVKVKQMKGAKPDCVTVQKKFSRDRAVTAYEVRDKPSALKVEDWDRVVAVFVLGKEWQFKDWPFKDHVEIFNKIIGFYMRFEDDSLESAKTVKQWNVKIISISKNKRHQDRAAALEVWERLEEFMRSRSRS